MSKETMNDLFQLLCEDYRKMLAENTMTPADRKTLIEFLKNNDITAIPATGSSLGNLVDKLPFDDDANANIIPMRK